MSQDMIRPYRATSPAHHYPYKEPGPGPWTLYLDGQVIKTAETEGELWAFLHATTSCSVSHALRWEGYSIKPPQEEPKP